MQLAAAPHDSCRVIVSCMPLGAAPHAVQAGTRCSGTSQPCVYADPLLILHQMACSVLCASQATVLRHRCARKCVCVGGGGRQVLPPKAPADRLPGPCRPPVRPSKGSHPNRQRLVVVRLLCARAHQVLGGCLAALHAARTLAGDTRVAAILQSDVVLTHPGHPVGE